MYLAMKKSGYMLRYRKTRETLAVQIAICLIVLLGPAAVAFFLSLDSAKAFEVLRASAICTVPVLFIYFVDYYYLVTRLLFDRRVWFFSSINLVLIVAGLSGIGISFRVWELPDEARIPAIVGLVMFLVTSLMVITYAIGARGRMKWDSLLKELEDEKQKNTEAELSWLKNQLNPHFLFNTLNNISSLVQIDADSAQDSISQLSDLLRYALYESNKPEVPLANEIEFMNNYIDLMKLRCNEMSTVTTDLQAGDRPIAVVPLLFISVIENAFKHGISTRDKSFVDIHLHVTGDDITFTCDNSNYPKPDTNRSGSGVGLENMGRRLELLYPERYTYFHELREGNVYHVEITLRDCTPQTLKEDKNNG